MVKEMVNEDLKLAQREKNNLSENLNKVTK